MPWFCDYFLLWKILKFLCVIFVYGKIIVECFSVMDGYHLYKMSSSFNLGSVCFGVRVISELLVKCIRFLSFK